MALAKEMEYMRFTRNTFKETTIFFFIFAAVSLAGCGSGSGADRTEETLVYYQLNYGAEAGGSVSNARQTVGREEDGSPVTVTPADGYHFIGWSDGKNDNPRTDTNITGNIGVEIGRASCRERVEMWGGAGVV